MSEDKKIIPGGELNDEELDEVSGGIQAGLICPGGPGEFGDPPLEEPPPRRPKWF